MALIAETATGFVTAMNVPDSAIVLIKTFKVDFKRPTKGAMTAIATAYTRTTTNRCKPQKKVKP